MVVKPLSIDLDGDRRDFRPGDTIRGRVHWSFADPPRALDLRLFWYTQGKGDQDVGIARKVRIDAPPPAGSKPFNLIAPSGPYSFSGKLISLTWALELVSDPDGQTERTELVMSPSGREIRLQDLHRNGAPT